VLDLSGWEILNVSNEESTNVYDSCFKAVYGENIEKYSSYQKAISELSIGDRGLLDMYDWIH
jgi:hypothetical protein